MADSTITGFSSATSLSTSSIIPVVESVGASSTKRATLGEIAPYIVDASAGWTRTATDAVARSVQAKLDEGLPTVKDFGAVGDGVTNDTTAFTRAAATGLSYIVPPGTYKITGNINHTSNGQIVYGFGEDSIIAGDGNFNTFSFGGGLLGGGLVGLRFNSSAKTGGYDYVLDNCYRCTLNTLFHYSTFSAGYFGLGNGHVLHTTLVNSFRGDRAWLFYGTDLARAGGTDIFIARCGEQSGGSGGIALEINGNVASIGMFGFFANGAPAGASLLTHGIKVHNGVGATLKPRFIIGTNVQIEFPKEEGLYIDAVDLLQITNLYSSAGIKSGVYLGSAAEKVTLSNPYISLNGRHGVYTEGQNVSINGGQIIGNSYNAYADNRGTYDGVHCANGSDHTTVTGVRIGDAGALTQRWGVYGASGAVRISVVGGDLINNILGPARDDTAVNTGNMQIIGHAGAPNASFISGLMVGAQAGARAAATASISGGAITGVTVTDAGYHYDSAPTVTAFDKGGGTGATLTATVANGKVTGVSVGAGGSGYTADTIIYFRPVQGTQAVRALNSTTTNVNVDIKAQGASGVRLGSEQGIGHIVTAAANSVNYVQTVGAATGTMPSVNAAGSDTNIDLTLVPKGTGNVRFGTHTGSADAAISGYIEIKDAGGTTRKLAVIS